MVLRKTIISQSNTRQALWVGVSSMSSFLVGLLTSIIFSRYFEKQDYGTYKQIIFIYTILLSLFSAGLPKVYSYFLPKLSLAQGRQVLNKLTNLFFLMGLVFSIFMYLASGTIAILLRNPDLDHALKLFSVVPLLMMPTMGVEGVYAAIRKTHILAIYTTLTRLGMFFIIVLPVILLKGTYETAIYGWMISSLLILILALYFKYRPFKIAGFERGTVTYRRILAYSLPLMFATLAGVAIRFADQFFISRYYGTEAFADYSNGFIPLPFVPMITGAIHAVFVPLFSRYHEKANGEVLISNSWRSGVSKAVILIYPILIFFVIFAKEVINILFGPTYDESTIYFRLAMIRDLSSPFLFYSILLATGRTDIYAKIHVVFAILIWFLGFIVCKISDLSVYYVILSVFLVILSRTVGLIASSRTINTSLFKMLDISSIFKIFAVAIGSGLISKLLADWIVEDQVIRLIMGGSIYAGLMFLSDKILRLKILETAISVIKKESVKDMAEK